MNHKYPPLSKNKPTKKEDYYLAKNSIPTLKEHLNIYIDKSNMLADHYKANKDLVKFGIY